MPISYQAPPRAPIYDSIERTAAPHEVIDEILRKIDAHNDDKSRVFSTYIAFAKLSRRLEELIHTEPDWNTYGSPAPTAGAIANAKEVLQLLQQKSLQPESVEASADGGVAFTFVSDTISRAAIECLNTGDSHVLLYDLKANSQTIDWPAARLEQVALIECLSTHLSSEGLPCH